MSVVYCHCQGRSVDTDKDESCPSAGVFGPECGPIYNHSEHEPCEQCRGRGCSACTDDDGLPL